MTYIDTFALGVCYINNHCKLLGPSAYNNAILGRCIRLLLRVFIQRIKIINISGYESYQSFNFTDPSKRPLSLVSSCPICRSSSSYVFINTVTSVLSTITYVACAIIIIRGKLFLYFVLWLWESDDDDSEFEAIQQRKL